MTSDEAEIVAQDVEAMLRFKADIEVGYEIWDPTEGPASNVILILILTDFSANATSRDFIERVVWPYVDEKLDSTRVRLAYKRGERSGVLPA